MEQQTDYSKWSTDELIKRVSSLEQQLKSQTPRSNPAAPSADLPPSVRKPKSLCVNREFDCSRYSTRLIALKLAYLGQRYNGLEFHANNTTPLPTVEEELWKALNKARLIFPTSKPSLEDGEPNWEGCEYSKCGRTDKGVSAFGQVVGIRVRSNRPLSHELEAGSEEEALGVRNIKEARETQRVGDSLSHNVLGTADAKGSIPPPSPKADSTSKSPSFHSINDELPYCQVLNRLLPPDIRILAWCPTPPPNFSARFSCKERQYRYFFTQPAFASTATFQSLPANQETSSSTSSPKKRKEGNLDIAAMRTAAHKFIGLHDFRNFCKLDASKQILNFDRRIFHADIQLLSTNPSHADLDSSNYHNLSTPALYAFTLHGSAFLWHQVRHMIAILFLIGQGLETPSLIDTLLDVKSTPCKPQYEMASDAPLVLWDCIFPSEAAESTNPTQSSQRNESSRNDALHWIPASDTPTRTGGLIDDIWRVWRRRKMDEVLAESLLNLVIAQDDHQRDGKYKDDEHRSKSQKVFQGGDAPKLAGKYVPVMQKPRMQSVEAVNARYAERKGLDQAEEERGGGSREGFEV